MKKSWEQIHQELSEPFSHEDVEWKIQTVSKDKSRGLAVAYVTARAIQNRLDAVVGAQNWKPVFRQWHTVTDRDGNPIPSQLCTIQIFDDERHEWLEKTDGAENTDYEPVKGGLSDAMKRAASQWGIGRYLYKLGTPWVDVEFFGKTAVIAKKEMPGLNQFHDDFIAKLKGPMPGNRSNPPQQERQRSETSPQSNTSSGNRATTNGSAKPKISIADTPRYTIRKAVPHRFKSGIMTIMDIECENGDVFTVFCDKPDDALRAGTVLTNLRVSQRPGKDDPNRRFNTLESYRVASAAYNPIADALPYFDQVQESFQLYRRCVNRRQMDTVLGKMLDDMEAVKVQSRGGMYFVPRQHMAKIDIFEDFLETMNEHALSENQVDVNSMYVVDNERQREKMAHEFYVALKKEIETYQERASHLINTGCESPTIMARWVSKIRELGEKRRRYEALFQRQISEVDGEFNTLQGFARELQVRIDHAHLKPLRSCA